MPRSGISASYNIHVLILFDDDELISKVAVKIYIPISYLTIWINNFLSDIYWKVLNPLIHIITSLINQVCIYMWFVSEFSVLIYLLVCFSLFLYNLGL